jgi:hypothetical protein
MKIIRKKLIYYIQNSTTTVTQTADSHAPQFKPRQSVNYVSIFSELCVFVYFTAAINGGQAFTVRVNSTDHITNDGRPMVQNQLEVN